MAQGSHSEPSQGLYNRLLERLSWALAEAGHEARCGVNPAQELELRGLSTAELQLICAYRDNDQQWLRGWQAATEELAFLDRHSRPVRHVRHSQSLRARLPHFCCVACGGAPERGLNCATMICAQCGSRLFQRYGAR